MNNSGEPEALRVGYILKMFPRLSETFILNELLALESHGVEASVFSLMHPNDGRFHGRMGQLNLSIDYVVREKPEAFWSAIRAANDDFTPSFARWEEAADFLRRWGIPKDLDLLLRAVVIARKVQERGIQHLHAHFATIATRVAALVNILCDVPFSFTSHAKDIFRQTVDRDLYADLVNRAAFNITVSDFNRDYIIEHTPAADAGKIIRLYNGIDLSFFPQREAHTPGAVPHFLSVGRLVEKKGFVPFLHALASWQQEGKPFRATIVGDGEDRDALHALQRELGLTESVTFAGALSQEQVQKLCADADVMVLACVPDELGNMDALPTTLLESLATDVPIVSTTLTGVPEIVGDEVGALAAPHDVAGLSRALDDVWRRVQAGEIPPGAARARAEELFDLQRNSAVLKEHFLRSARSDRGARTPQRAAGR